MNADVRFPLPEGARPSKPRRPAALRSALGGATVGVLLGLLQYAFRLEVRSVLAVVLTLVLVALAFSVFGVLFAYLLWALDLLVWRLSKPTPSPERQRAVIRRNTRFVEIFGEAVVLTFLAMVLLVYALQIGDLGDVLSDPGGQPLPAVLAGVVGIGVAIHAVRAAGAALVRWLHSDLVSLLDDEDEGDRGVR